MDEIEIIIEPAITEVVIEVQEAAPGSIPPSVEARLAALEDFKENGTINGGIIF